MCDFPLSPWLALLWKFLGKLRGFFCVGTSCCVPVLLSSSPWHGEHPLTHPNARGGARWASSGTAGVSPCHWQVKKRLRDGTIEEVGVPKIPWRHKPCGSLWDEVLLILCSLFIYYFFCFPLFPGLSWGCSSALGAAVANGPLTRDVPVLGFSSPKFAFEISYNI